MSDKPQEGAAPAKMPEVRVGDVCRLAGDLQESLPASERILRKGPYPYYVENGAVSRLEDYAVEAGGAVMVPAVGSVLSARGFLTASYEEGRCAASEHVHALIPHDPADGRYLWRVLTNSRRAASMVTGTSQLRQLGAGALLATRIPWPAREARDAFVRGIDEYDRRIAELADLVPALLREGDEAFAAALGASGEARVAAGEAAAWAQGTDVPAALRAPGKPVRVEGPLGGLGFCDEALADGLAIMVGPSGRHLLAHMTDRPVHPIAEMRYVTQDTSRVALPVLFFALRAAGLPDRLRLGGKLVDAPRLSMDDLPGVELALGTAEERGALEPVAADLVRRAVEAERGREALVEERREFIESFMATAVPGLPGSAGADAPVLGDLPAPRGESRFPEKARQAARAAVEARAASAAPGLPLSAAQREALGPLAGLVEADAFGLAPADLAWELGPLAVVRALAGEAWGPVAAAAGEPGCPGLVAALDAAMASIAAQDDLLSFLPNLSYQSSLLAPEQLGGWVRALDAAGPSGVTARSVRAAFMLEPGSSALPDAVALVLESVLGAAAASLPGGAETAYVPCEAREGVVDALGRVLPDTTLRAQFDEFSHVLSAAMARAVGLAGRRDTRGGLGAAAGSALVADEFADWDAPLVAAALPPNGGAWTQAAVPAGDPRWVLGTPPRAKANYAWLQHALSHQLPGGLTVLLACNSLLHSTSGSEPRLREKLAESGRVRLVASLPARIFDDGRPAMSLLVLGDPREAAAAPQCLMVDALGLAEPNPDASPELFADGVGPDGLAQRVLPGEAARRVASVCAAWVSGGCAGAGCEEPGLARAVGLDELLANGALLAPWTYVGGRGE